MNFATNILNFGNAFAEEARYQPGVSSAIGLNFQLTGTNLIPLRNGAADNKMLSAIWSQSEASDLKYVYLLLKRAGTITSGNVQVRICSDASGAPDVTLAVSSRVSASGISGTAGYVKFTFPMAVSLDADTTYHLVLEGDYEASATNQIQWRAKTVASGGNALVYDSAWVANTTLMFEVYASVPVIFDNGFEDEMLGNSPVTRTQVSVLARTADVAYREAGATLTVNSVDYRVVKSLPGIDGVSTLVLLPSSLVNS